jgi:RNA polymerase sigma-70 factor (ECF subfamily)
MRDDVSATDDLLCRARQGDAEALGQLFEAQRADLHEQAERQLRGRLSVRVDPSDIIQQTFLEAHRSFAQFAGEGPPEWTAWLRTILDRRVALAVREHVLLQKRDLRRERSLDSAPSDTDSGSGPQLEAGHSSPSQRAIRGEEVQRLAAALAVLPPDQREAVRLRHLENQPLAEIAKHLGRSLAATAGLIKRGMKTLRAELRERDPESGDRDGGGQA